LALVATGIGITIVSSFAATNAHRRRKYRLSMAQPQPKAVLTWPPGAVTLRRWFGIS